MSKSFGSSLIYFTLPTIGFGYMYGLINLYLMIFATDFLAIAPATVGFIFGISRLWDAISDPLIGHLSDNTRTRFGRRRPWLVIAAVPLGFAFYMLFNPASGSEELITILWFGTAVILFYTASTLFYVPHFAIAAELTEDYHQRNVVFGCRHAGWLAGYVMSLGGIYSLTILHSEGAEKVIDFAGKQATFIGFLTAISVLICAYGMREKPGFVERRITSALPVIKDVFKNMYARRILIVNFMDNVSFALTSTLVIYVCTYILNDANIASVFILFFMLPSLLLVPIWMPLARKFGKKNLYTFSMLLSGTAFGSLFFADYNNLAHLYIAGIMAGTANGCNNVIGPSIFSDIIDYDELQTGDRKEGAYFAVWSLVWKSSTALVLFILGMVLSFVGFEPNVPQTDLVIDTMKFMFTLLPCMFYILAAFMFSFFKLNEETYNNIRTELDTNREATQL